MFNGGDCVEQEIPRYASTGGGGLIGTATTKRPTVPESLSELAKSLMDIRTFIDDALEPRLKPVLRVNELKDCENTRDKVPNNDSDLFNAISEMYSISQQIRNKLSDIQSRIQL